MTPRDIIEIITIFTGAMGLVVGAFRLGSFAARTDAVEERNVIALDNITSRMADGFAAINRRFDEFDDFRDDVYATLRNHEHRITQLEPRA